METKTLNDKNLQKYYDDKLATYASPGWTLLVGELEEALKQYRDIGYVTEKYPLDFRLGQVDILNWMVKQREMHELALESLLLDQDSEADGGE